MDLRFRCNLSSNQILHFYCGMLTMPYHREDDGLPIATITCALVFIYKTTAHTFTHFILYYVSLESRK